MKQARIEWQGQVRDVLVNERDRAPGRWHGIKRR